MLFVENLRAIRNQQGFTQRQVAEGLGIAESQYQNYEQGRRKPGLDALIALADFFNVSLDYLVGREPPTREELL